MEHWSLTIAIALGHEFDGLRFLKSAGIGKALPNALAVDREERCALYEWIDGASGARTRSGGRCGVLKLMGAMHAARFDDGVAALPEATEAVLRRGDLEGQIRPPAWTLGRSRGQPSPS